LDDIREFHKNPLKNPCLPLKRKVSSARIYLFRYDITCGRSKGLADF
jgi:hypothetical protein